MGRHADDKDGALLAPPLGLLAVHAEATLLGSLIKAWRAQHRYGVRATAKMVGVSPATLSRIENGKPMDQKSMMKVMRWLFG